MPPVSTIDRLSPELRMAVQAELDSGKTLDEVVGAVSDMGLDISRSSLGRYKQRMDKILEKTRETRVVAEVLAASFGRGSGADIIRGNAELLHGVLLRATTAYLNGEDHTAYDVEKLARALSSVASSSRAAYELERLEDEKVKKAEKIDAVKDDKKKIDVVFIDGAQIEQA